MHFSLNYWDSLKCAWIYTHITLRPLSEKGVGGRCEGEIGEGERGWGGGKSVVKEEGRKEGTGKKEMTEGRWREGLERKGGRVEEKKGGGWIAYFDQGIPSIARGPLPAGTHIFGPSSRKTGYIWISNFIQLNLIRHVKSIKQISTHLTWLDTWKNNNQKSTAKQGIERWSPTDKLRHLNQSVIKII